MFRVFHLAICTSQFQNRPPPPPPRAIPGHLTRVTLHTVGNLTQNEAHPAEHLTFVSKRLSAVGKKRISQFFESAHEPRSQAIALVDSTSEIPSELSRENFISSHEKITCFIFFQAVTVTNSAICLVLSAVRIFLSLTTVTVKQSRLRERKKINKLFTGLGRSV